jgi:hypothetical protein
VLWAGQVIEEGPADEVLASTRTEVHQLVNGILEGPLGMAGEGHIARPPLPRSRGHAEEGFDIPLPAAVFALLVVISASALILGGGHPVELAIVVGAWVVSAVLVGLRHLRRRR